MGRYSLVLALAGGVACSDFAASKTAAIQESVQRGGNAEIGYTALVNEGYVGCGVPYEAYAQAFAPAAGNQLISGRIGRNDGLPYNFTAFETNQGVEVVTPNCLQCHAEYLNGELVLGLGNHTADYTMDVGIPAILAGGLVNEGINKTEWERWKDRMVAIAPFTITRTVGVNPADNLAAVLFAHRIPETLEWSDEPLLELPPRVVVPVDVPPWWHMKKKNAMFYTAAGRGDHARIMMTASTLCVDSVDQAQKIDSYFPDVREYLLSIEAPRYPWEIDTAAAEQGRVLFEGRCSSCHGTYGDGGAYPNLLVDVDEVGTDDILSRGVAQFGGRFVEWFNSSFFGELSELAPKEGYVAPPLDGIWASAPYFHNGSVPTLALVLDSTKRPTYFVRSYDTDSYDSRDLGWPYRVLESGHDDPPSGVPSNQIYDTTQLGYGNGGHTFADHFAAEERAYLLEYLKTL